MKAEIKRISILDTLAIRQQVLWPDKSLEEVRVPGDDKAMHIGAFISDSLVCVASLFISDNSAIRLRKFATIEAHQGKGIGTEVLNYALDLAVSKRATHFWFDARESALPFYLRFGFKSKGKRFYKGSIPYFRMEKPLKHDER
ncbi:GNAT family N-acetyltransferase [Vibrio sp. SCSIO 43135]|uniref:GNAT family N-acetyltransferase n=1 Tax=Vibrio sp. SCSIO 43135 TaxID=2819096 RepID=UPI002074D3B6|nr:GNAT family N-acetyltransferase [Vibrio sp. SCSIO 43135]USD42611.1 GNAT family N-acetyltransferase [Vibrio sp. SCSIO 43135]